MFSKALLIASLVGSTFCNSVALSSAFRDDDPRKRYAIQAITFNGAKFFSNRQLLDASKLRRGSIFTDDYLRAAASRLSVAYHRKGYIRMQVTSSKYFVNNSNDTGHPRIDVVFDIKEGPQFLIRALEIIGNSITPDSLITRSIGMRPWDPYDPTAIDAAIKRLNRIRTLDVVQKEDLEVSVDEIDSRVDLRIHLKEKPWVNPPKTVGVSR